MDRATLDRAQILIQWKRYGEAEALLRAHLADGSDDWRALCLLGECLLGLDRNREALVVAQSAIASSPEEALPHALRSRVFLRTGRTKAAIEAVREAIRIDTDEPAHFALLASAQFQSKDWSDALAAANQGLSLNPDDASCLNLRAMALTQLGRKEEARLTIEGALQRQPDDSTTHANQGWTALHQRDYDRALIHFRESLRLDPENEWASSGILEALKARHRIYHVLLQFQLWMSRLKGNQQFLVIIAGMLGYNVVVSALRSGSPWAQILWIPVIAYLAFVLLTWFGDAVFTGLLTLSQFGRLLVPTQKKRQVASILSLLGAGLGLAAYGFIGEHSLCFLGGLLFALASLPLQNVFVFSALKKRLALWGFLGIVFAIALFIWTQALGIERDRRALVPLIETKFTLEDSEGEAYLEFRKLIETPKDEWTPEIEKNVIEFITEHKEFDLSQGDLAERVKNLRARSTKNSSWMTAYTLLCFLVSQFILVAVGRWPED